MSGPYLWNHYSQRLQTEHAAWSCGLILHYCLPSNSLRYWTKVRGIAPRSHTGRPRTCLVYFLRMGSSYFIFTLFSFSGYFVCFLLCLYLLACSFSENAPLNPSTVHSQFQVVQESWRDVPSQQPEHSLESSTAVKTFRTKHS